MKTSRRRDTVVACTALSVVLVLCLVLVEAGVRFFVISRGVRYLHVDTSVFPYFHLPDSYREPGLTIQNGRRELLPRSGRPRSVAFLGDSHTFGVDIDDSQTFTEQLQAAQSSWDIYNYGVPGYGVMEVAAVLETITPRRHFDLVIYAFNFNDLFVAMALHLPLLGNGKTRLALLDEYQGGYGRLKGFLKDHFKTAVVLKGIWDERSLRSRMKPPASGTPALTRAPGSTSVAVPVSDESCVPWQLGLADAAGGEPYRSLERVYSDDRLLQAVGERIARMRDRVKEQGGRFVVIPHYDLPILHRKLEVPVRRLRALLDGLGVERWDPYPLYSEHYRECGFFYSPGHLGAKGNTLLAQWLLPRLNAL